MNRKTMIKMGIDLVMTVLLLCQMAYMLIGNGTRVVGRSHVYLVYPTSYPELALAQKFGKGQIYRFSYFAGNRKFPGVCLHDRADGQRHNYVEGSICVSAH